MSIVMESNKTTINSNSSERSSSSIITGGDIDSDETIVFDDPNIPKPALNGAIYKGNLYLNLLNVPIGDLPKELFIKALDKAEEAGCNKVILCLDKVAHKEHIRTFMFLDFKLLPPNHPLVPGWDCSKNILFMGCDLEGGDV